MAAEERALRPAGLTSAPPDRLWRLPSWLLIRLYGPANRLVAGRLGDPDARADYAVLASLAEYGAMSQADLGRRLAVDRSDVVALVNQLSGGDLVDRAPDPADRRRNTITITAAGRRALRSMDRRVARAQGDFLAPLSPEERDRFVATLQRLVDHHYGLGVERDH